MKYKKIIYIRYIPLTGKIFKDCYMKEVSEIGIKVEYWDISKLFFDSHFNQEDSSHLTTTRKFSTYRELENEISSERELTQVLFFSIMTFEGRVEKLYEIFTKYNCNLAVYGRNVLPISHSSIKRSIISRILRLNFRKIVGFVKNKRILIKKRNGKIKPYDIIFMGGEKGWFGVGEIDYNEVINARVVKLNSDDYDNYLSIKDEVQIIKKEYILFLDEYLPLHPDTKLFGIKNITAESYYPQLLNYFDRIEKQFNMKVIIAAHPKAIRYKEEDFFNNREVYFGKSAILSKNAFFVIAHDSTSINYPIAFNKKIHFITSKNIEIGINQTHLNTIHIANELGYKIQYFDSNEEIKIIEEIQREKYLKYKYDYLTFPETEKTLSKEIFINFFKS